MSKLLIYVAGASAPVFRERARKWMRAVEAAGCELTLDWLRNVEEAKAQGGGANEGLTHAERVHHAEADWAAVRRADVVWVLAPDNASTGAWGELTFALAQRREVERYKSEQGDWGIRTPRVLISGPSSKRCIFAALAEEFATDEEAFAALLEIEKASR